MNSHSGYIIRRLLFTLIKHARQNNINEIGHGITDISMLSSLVGSGPWDVDCRLVVLAY